MSMPTLFIFISFLTLVYVNFYLEKYTMKYLQNDITFIYLMFMFIYIYHGSILIVHVDYFNPRYFSLDTVDYRSIYFT